MEDTIFTKIIEGKLPSKKVYENEHILVIHDIHPVAPVHLLIITKKEIPTLQQLETEDLFLIGEMIKAAQHVAKELKLDNYRLVNNCGSMAGQQIYHLHFHLISGKRLGGMA